MWRFQDSCLERPVFTSSQETHGSSSSSSVLQCLPVREPRIQQGNSGKSVGFRDQGGWHRDEETVTKLQPCGRHLNIERIDISSWSLFKRTLSPAQ